MAHERFAVGGGLEMQTHAIAPSPPLRGHFTMMRLNTLPALLLAFLGFAASASAAPIWNVESEALPTTFQSTDGPGNDVYRIELENLGESSSSGTITLVDHLPPGITTSQAPRSLYEGQGSAEWTCADQAAGQQPRQSRPAPQRHADHRQQRRAEAVVRRRILRLKRQRTLVLAHRNEMRAGAIVRFGEIVMRLDKRG